MLKPTGKTLIVIAISLLVNLSGSAQRYLDSIRHALETSGPDTSRVKDLVLMATWYESTSTDSNYYYAQEANALAERLHYAKGKFFANSTLFFAANRSANYTQALEIALRGIQIAQSIAEPEDKAHLMAYAYGMVTIVKNEMHDTIGRAERNQLAAEWKSKLGRMDGDFWPSYMAIANQFHSNRREDSARHNWELALAWSKRATSNARFSCLAAAFYGNYLVDSCGDYPLARDVFQEGIEWADYYNNIYIKTRLYKDLIHFFIRSGNPDSAIYFGRLAIALATRYHFGDYASMASDSLAGIFERNHRLDSAIHYIRINQSARDSIFSGTQLIKFRAVFEENERRLRDQEAAKEKYLTNIKIYASLGALALFLLISVILYRNNRQKQKANILLSQQKEEIAQALAKLKATQAQLVQSEKMASLGEMTAGIAHEIQNPLNFVNNFSELNTELISELKAALLADNTEEVQSLSGLIENNLQKITEHGKRADNIVKGMLQHSRVSTGQKEATDINALCDEYLRLAFHGMRAKDKNFAAEWKTVPDPAAGKVPLIPQDIGRVLLNLCNNAFYAVDQKARQELPGYLPMVSISTKKTDKGVEIRVKDNGTGIPDHLKKKIFQPFFTTKPTGQGTGLGLSLSYDIIKAHGGELSAESSPGEGTTMIITLPTS